MGHTLKASEHFLSPDFPFQIMYYPFQPDEIVSEHAHDFIELVYVVEGHASHTVSGVHYNLAKGDVYVLEPGVGHSYHSDGVNPAIIYNILLHRDFLSSELRSLADLPAFVDFFYLSPFLRKNATFVPYASVAQADREPVEQALCAMRREIALKSSCYQLVVKTQLISCLVYFSRAQQTGPFHPKPAHNVNVVHQIAEFLDQHFNEPMTLPNLARLAGCSVSSLTSKFKQDMGMTVLEYRHARQVREARRLLLDTELSVVDVCHASGFEDLSYFYRVFRRHTSVSPARLRQRHEAPHRL